MKGSASILFAVLCLFAGAAQAEIKTQWVDYKEGDAALQGYLAFDDSISGKRPGILLLHRRDGMSDLTLANAKMYAQQGYVVFAPDIFGKDIRPKTVPEMQAQTALYTANRPLMRARAQAGFDVLRSNPMVDPSRIATVGYCFGGQVAVEFAETGAPIVGSVAIHGSFRGYRPKRRRTSTARC
jgi:dienelactone hydrolase